MLVETDAVESLSNSSALVYSTFLDGIANDFGESIRIDTNLNAYVTGYTESDDFPMTSGAFETSHNSIVGIGDVFVSKLNETGSQLIYSTYLGGTDIDWGNSIKINSEGNIYITGPTWSTDFPVTSNAYDMSIGGFTDTFVAKLNLEGNSTNDLVYATYLGGNDDDSGWQVETGPTPPMLRPSLVLDNENNVYISSHTNSSNFPTTSDAYDASFTGVRDGFIAKLNANGSTLLYSTYLGGSSEDIATLITIDSVKDLYIIGFTTSPEPLLNCVTTART